ncbi:MAG: hypothetical protein ACRDAR_16260 [Aeromonas veronii]
MALSIAAPKVYFCSVARNRAKGICFNKLSDGIYGLVTSLF